MNLKIFLSTKVLLFLLLVHLPEAKLEGGNFTFGMNNEVPEILIKDVDDEKSIILYLKVSSKVQFHVILPKFKALIAEVATKYCNEEMHVSVRLTNENINFQGEKPCPASWPDSDKCLTGYLSVTFDVNPNFLRKPELHTVWELTKLSKLNELQIQEYVVPESNRTLIITLVGIIVFLGIALLVVLYIFRERIKSTIHSFFHKRETNNTSDDQSWAYRENDVYNSHYTQPPPYAPSSDYIQPIQICIQTKMPNNNTYLTIIDESPGIQNQGYVPDNNDGVKYTRGSKDAHHVDDFDSDEDIIFPSPLKAPPLPPRPGSKQTANINKEAMHYMVSPIKS